MPTEKFLKLCEYKKQAILKAMCDEFLQKPYAEITVSGVIRRSDISRASFYTYFSGKDDLFQSLLVYMKKQLGKKLSAIFCREKGSYFNSMKWVWRQLLEDDVGQIYCRLGRKLMTDEGCRELSVRTLTEFSDRGLWSEEGKLCYAAMNDSLYPGLDEKQLSYVIDLGLLIITRAAFMNLDSSSCGRQQEIAVEKQLEILEKGIRA